MFTTETEFLRNKAVVALRPRILMCITEIPACHKFDSKEKTAASLPDWTTEYLLLIVFEIFLLS